MSNQNLLQNRKLRTFLFIPANKIEKYINKAIEVKPDAIVIDFEDSVALNEKEIARINLLKFASDIKNFNKEIEILVRLNSSYIEFFKDVKLFEKDEMYDFKKRLHSYLIPKAEADEAIKSDLENLFDPNKSLQKISNLLETIGGFEIIDDVMKSSKSDYVFLGNADFCADFSIQENSFTNQYLKAKFVVSAKINNLIPIDSPYFDINDLDGLKKDTEQSKANGFGGRLLIHPSHVLIVKQVYQPSQHEIDDAINIIKISEDGVGTYQGKMVDEALAKKAREILIDANMQDKI